MSTKPNMEKNNNWEPVIKKGPPVKKIKSRRNISRSELIAEHKSMMIERETHSGPLPSPRMLQEYNDIDSSFAERIVSMAERQSAHRQELEKIAVKSGSRDSLLGLIFGFTIGLSTIIVGYWLGINGHTVASSIIGTGGVAGLVSVFVYGTRSKRSEREDKRK